jgi:hypothetical protein
MNIGGQQISKYNFERVYYIHFGNTRNKYTSFYEAGLHSAQHIHYGTAHPQAGNGSEDLEVWRVAANIYNT